MTVLEIITDLISKRKEERKVPHCAMLRDVIDQSGLSIDEIRKEVRELKKAGKISIRETINSTSSYLR